LGGAYGRSARSLPWTADDGSPGLAVSCERAA
jgi:hypothetical protein